MISKKDFVFYNAAKEIANLSDFKRIHIGCVITYKNRIISSGYNTNKTNPIQKKYNIFRFSCEGKHGCHAETMALLPLLKDKKMNHSKMNIYLYREDANGQLAMSRPCSSCLKMLQDNGFNHIFYTTNNGYAEEYMQGV